MYTIYQFSRFEERKVKSLMSELIAIKLAEIWTRQAVAFNCKVNYFVKGEKHDYLNESREEAR